MYVYFSSLGTDEALDFIIYNLKKSFLIICTD